MLEIATEMTSQDKDN